MTLSVKKYHYSFDSFMGSYIHLLYTLFIDLIIEIPWRNHEKLAAIEEIEWNQIVDDGFAFYYAGFYIRVLAVIRVVFRVYRLQDGH